ncbi:phosphodiester glycosidase family protein [Geosporobacter ferrireducens]|uniref:Phosphodiester glycosidase domain-containing protein n=1 Tax=Geosporobacter ferrireducens TaxID=1424294 RepID=A0A1D8GGK0_9FIRM|nr:phosphodiester glycosidase family protein [Geosporobacter ferrireducens]AOT70044.1 hypothetical protein Gferi_10870 [Geosporobacter ferrireducens]
MLNRKRLFTLLLTFVTLFSINLDALVYADWTTSIYENRNTTTIAKGVIHEHIQRFTDAGWLNINVLRISLSEPSNTIDLLMGPNGLSEKARLSEMVSQNERVVGAINGDFFMTNNSSTIGPMVQDGQLLATPFSKPDQMATFNITNEGMPYIAPWVYAKIELQDNNGLALNVGLVNKETDYNSSVILYTPQWGAEAPAPHKNLTNPTYLVVENDTVKQIAAASADGIAIPANGYVILTSSSSSDRIRQSLLVEDPVSLSFTAEPDLNNLSLTLGGGATLVKNGVAASTFTHNITGSHPRTALGISRDKQEVLLVTIDGRTSSYTGVTQQELANIMVYLGAYDAMNLDGGGSTEMIVRPLGENNKKIANNLSDGGERRLMNGIGVVNNAPITDLSGIILEVQDKNVFVNTSRELTLKAYDKNHNPLNVDWSRVSWEVSGVQGTVQGNSFRPTTAGSALITAQYDGTAASLALRVLDNPVRLSLSPATLNLGANAEKQIQATLVNGDGYSASIHPRELNFSIPAGLGTMDDRGFFRASAQGATGLIQATYGNLEAYIAATVGTQDRVIDNFEKLSGTFLSYPTEVKGSYELASIAKEGNFSGKLSYDFTTTDATRAAYLVFNNGGISLEQRPSKIGMWVFGNEGGGHWLRAKAVGADGTAQTIDLSSSIDWEGWKYVEANIPSTMKAPIKLERIYVVQTDPLIKNTGSILIDQLTASYPISYQGTVPAPASTADKRNVKAELKGENSFRFFAHGLVSGIDTLQDNMAVTKMAELANKETEMSLFTEAVDPSLSKALKNPVFLGNSGYASTKHKNSLFIKLDNTKGGLRETNVSQWSWFLKTMENLDAGSVFVVLPKSLAFKDPLEEKLFKDTLKKAKENKNADIWVFTPSTNGFAVTPEEGIRYVSLKAFPKNNDYDIFTQLQYMRFTVNDDQVTYEILPMYTK